MGFGVNAYASIKNITTDEKGNTTAQVSTSYKDRKANIYRTDFLSKYVQMRGNALEKLNELQNAISSSDKNSARIKITSCSSSNCYEDADGNLKFLKNDRYTIFDFELVDNSKDSNNPSGAISPVRKLPSPADLDNPDMFIPPEANEELPFG